MKTTIATIVAAAALAGCAAPNVTPYQLATFDKAQAEKWLQPGTNTIKGSALIRQAGGGVVNCAGGEVQLIPATEHAKQRMLNIYGSTVSGYRRAFSGPAPKFENESTEYLHTMRKTTCDAQGFFKFDKVADGDFFVITVVTWRVTQYFPEGGALMQRVDVGGGETKEIVLTAR